MQFKALVTIDTDSKPHALRVLNERTKYEEEYGFAYTISTALEPMLYVLIISHKHGVDASVHTDEDGAFSAALDWAEQWWDEEVGEDVERPADPEELVRTYFERVEHEFYDIDRAALS